LTFNYHGEVVAQLDPEDLVLGGNAPVYERAYVTPGYFKEIKLFSSDNIPYPESLFDAARKLIASPNLASKAWIYQQYDHTVRTNTIFNPETSDANLVRIKGTNKAIAASVDCNSAYAYADPYVGALMAVCEAARNIVCTGAKPLAITNCLNFGNPYNPEVFFQFKEAVRGITDACTRLQTPVTGGNVSFYNQYTVQQKTIPIYPTPTIGMIGLLNDVSKVMSLDFKESGDLIYLIGSRVNNFNSSEYLRHNFGIELSPAPEFT